MSSILPSSTHAQLDAEPDTCGRCWNDGGPDVALCLHGPRYADQPRPGWYHPRTWADGVMPLWEFPECHRLSIEEQVAWMQPPPRWLKGELFQLPSRAWHEWHWSRGLRLRRVPGFQPRNRRHIPDALRLAVYERDGFTCLHCGSVQNLSLDHIHPYSRGGLDVLDNLQTLCRSCNSRKGAKV